ncbi:hypothetical protein Tco_1285207 [Tanacetum coccineum]
MLVFEGELPVKYLRVPLISSRLLNKDCKILVEKAKNQIGDWKSKSLSFAGRLQLYTAYPAPNFTKIRRIRHADTAYPGLTSPKYAVWSYVRCLADMQHVPPIMHDNLSHLQPMANKRMVRNVIGRILLAAISYFIWLEHNNRIFKKVRRSPKELRDNIMVAVRLKLLTFHFKNTDVVNQLLSRWKMPKTFRLYGC